MAEARVYPVQVNVQDFGAVPDGVTDCSVAFQRAVEALDPNPFLGGGTVYIPAAENFYALSRSVIVDHTRVRIVGESRERSVVETTSYSPAFIFGLPRGSKQHPLSREHWVDLHGILDDSAFAGGVGRWGYRTKADEVCTLSFPASPFAFGPSGANYWQGVRQFTLDFVVRNNAGPWADHQQLFGLVDAVGEPGPWFAQVRVLPTGAVMLFSFRTNDGLRREIRVPIKADQAVLRCSLQLDLGTGAVAAWVGHGQVTPDLSWINDGWPTPQRPSSTLAFVPNWYSPFNLATLTPNSNGVRGIGQIQVDPDIDLTFGALRLSNVLRYADAMGQPQRTTSGTAVTDSMWLNASAGEFARLPMNEDVRLGGAGLPDFQVPWAAKDGGNGYGVMVSSSLADPDTLGTHSVTNLTINCGRRFGNQYGQGIAVGQVYGFAVEDVTLAFGAQGLGSYNFGVSYPVDLRMCDFQVHSDAGIYSWRQILHGSSLTFGWYGRSAVKTYLGNVTLRDVFCTGASNCVSPVRLYETVGQFDNWQFDFEGDGVGDSYFWATIADAIGGPTQLAIRDCQGVNGDPTAVAVRLVASDRNGGIATSLRRAGWCTIERSFNNYLSPTMRAVVAVDGPMWSGTYTGLPPARPQLVVTTAAPGASARIGEGVVPPAQTVPAVPSDPIPTLPGLLGYYRAEGLTVPDAAGKPRPATDGDQIQQLTDLGPGGNHGTFMRSPAVFEPGAVNGLAALRFTGGWYKFPSHTGTDGTATIFLVTKGAALVETGTLRLWVWQWQQYSPAATVSVRPHTSDVDWVVQAVRFSTAGGRILRCWTNGHVADTQRLDTVGDAQWTAPTLGTILGGDVYRGLFSTLVYCASALADDQVELVNRYLLHRHAIAV